MSELWLMSAATFRRLGKIDQAKGAIQEAELRDETNPNVWVQVCVQPAYQTRMISDVCLLPSLALWLIAWPLLRCTATIPTRYRHTPEGPFHCARRCFCHGASRPAVSRPRGDKQTPPYIQ